MRDLKTRLSHVLLTALLCPAVFAQTGSEIPSATGSARIRLNVVVTPSSKSGQPIPELPQSDFTVLDNGQPQPLESFRALPDKANPAKTYIVIDAVNIDYTRLAYERSQLEKYLNGNDGKLASPTSLVVVTDTTTQATPGFTNDGHVLSQSLEQDTIGLRELRRTSGFYGAEDRLDLSLRALEQLIATAKTVPGRKAIVWVSPGWPLLSGPRVELTAKQENGLYAQVVALSNQIREADVTLYSVDPLGAAENPGRTFYYEEFLKGVRKPSQVQIGNLGLQVLAVQSGGLALSSSNDVASLLQRCADDLHASYEITYQPPPSDASGAYHQVQVKLPDPHLVARTSQGYYAQP